MTSPPPIRLTVLVVDDEPGIRRTVAMCVEGEGHDVVAVANGGDALAAVQQGPVDIAFLDVRLGTSSGLDLIPAFLEEIPWLKIIVMTAYASVETAVEAMKRGAADYLTKPFTPAHVRVALEKASEVRSLERKVEQLLEVVRDDRPEFRLESRNKAMRELIDTARKVAASDATVLLKGESGTGKGVLARAIHAWSPRAGRPFVIVHAPSLSKDLLESELFGHVKGAFTGALRTNPGRIAQAEGGLLFIDEIGDLPLPLQPRLLRIIQEHEYERVGDPATRRADVRIVAATNQDLEALVEGGHFREDLFYRLSVVPLEVPPLRMRPEDIPQLTHEFLDHFGRKYNRPSLRLTREAEEALRRHSWPGNVRELENALERAVILSKSDVIGADAMAFVRRQSDSVPEVGAMISLAELEREHIRRVVEATPTLEEAAAILKVDRSTLWRLRKQYDI